MKCRWHGKVAQKVVQESSFSSETFVVKLYNCSLYFINIKQLRSSHPKVAICEAAIKETVKRNILVKTLARFAEEIYFKPLLKHQ